MRQVGATIWVRFLNKTCLSKTYAFYLDKECNLCRSNDSFRDTFVSYTEDGRVFAKFMITNENGYNYRGGEVVITDYAYGDYFINNPSIGRNITFLNEIKYIGDTDFIAFGNNTRNKNLPIDYKELREMPLDNLTDSVTKVEISSKNISNSINSNSDTISGLCYTAATANSNKIAECNCKTESIVDSSGTSLVWADIPLSEASNTATIRADDFSILKSNSTVLNITKDYDIINSKINTIEERVRNMETKNTVENGLMTNLMKDVKFGKAPKVRMSMYGPAFLGSDNEWLSWDKKNEEWVDVTGLTFDEGFAYMMPVAKDDVAVGDFILHNKMWVRVLDITEDLCLVIEKPFEKEKATMLPTTNMFGFDFYTKLVYFGIDSLTATADKKNPFGNLIPFLMLKENGGNDILPLMMMMNGTKGFDFKNPMMMYFLMKDSKNNDLLPLMMCMNNK